MKKYIVRFLVVTALLFVGWQAAPLAIFSVMLASGKYTSARTNTPFEEAHQRAVSSFAESNGFGLSRIRLNHLWNEYSVNYQDTEYLISGFHLVGLTPEYGQRLFTDHLPPKKNDTQSAASRELFPDEKMAVSRLLSGSISTVEMKISLKGDELRLLAPIYASEDCTSCHSVKTGDILGAFDYRLEQRFEK